MQIIAGLYNIPTYQVLEYYVKPTLGYRLNHFDFTYFFFFNFCILVLSTSRKVQISKENVILTKYCFFSSTNLLQIGKFIFSRFFLKQNIAPRHYARNEVNYFLCMHYVYQVDNAPVSVSVHHMYVSTACTKYVCRCGLVNFEVHWLPWAFEF